MVYKTSKTSPPTFDPNVTQAKLEYDKIEKIHFFRSDIIFLSHFWGKKSLDFA